MYCYKCGKEIPDSAMFCNFCGANQQNAAKTESQNNYEPQYSYEETPKKKSKGKKIGGIILLILAAFAIFGRFANGSYAEMIEYGLGMEDIVGLAIEIGMLVGGFNLISKS